MKLNVFNGGLNTRQAPELIGANEAVICENVSLDSDQISSAKGLGSASVTAIASPFFDAATDTWHADAINNDYLAYQGGLYWTNAGRAQKHTGGVTRNLGIDQPTVTPSVVADLQLTPPSFTLVRKAYGLERYAATITSGDFPAGTVEIGITEEVDGNVVAVYTTTIDVPASSGLETGIPGGVPTPAVAGATLGGSRIRKYNGVWYNVSAFDNVYDISGHTVANITLSSNRLQLNTNYTVSIALEHIATGVMSEVSTQTNSISEPGWLYCRLNSTLPAGTRLVWFMGNQKLTRTYLANLPEYVSPITYREPLGVNGVLQYVYTYYNSTDGTESQPSPVSSELDIGRGTASITVTASADPQITHIKLYRVGGALISFTEVAELSNTTQTYVDSTADLDVTGSALASTLNGAPQDGLRYLTQAQGVFFGALGPKLYFTRDIGNPNYWPEAYYIDLHQDITGIGITSSGVIVFTKYETYLISGTNSSTFVKYLISSDQGCLNHKSIAAIGGTLLFVSTDGICSVSGNKVEVVSKFKLGKLNLNTVNAVIYDEAYYLQLVDESILVLDFRYGPQLKYYSFGTDYLAVANDVLYGQTTAMFPMFSGANVEYHYATGNLTEGAISEIKQYNNAYVYLTGTATIKVYINDVLVQTSSLVGQTKPVELLIPHVNQTGSSIKFDITGVGTIKEIEYKATGRANGR